MISIREIMPKCFLVTSPSQFEVTDTFLRPQEYYESDLEGIRGKYFSLDAYIQRYAQKYGNFTYYDDWAGFNVPGESFSSWFKSVVDEATSVDLRTNELILVTELMKLGIRDNPDDYYLIGVKEGNQDVINHEIAHALYYLDLNYKREIDKHLDDLKTKLPKCYIDFSLKLKGLGYCKEVIRDEMQAYLTTSAAVEISERFKMNPKHEVLKKLRDVYVTYRPTI